MQSIFGRVKLQIPIILGFKKLDNITSRSGCFGKCILNVIQLLQLYFDKEVQLESFKFLKFLRIIVYTEVSPTQDFQLRASMHFFSSKGMYF